MTNNNQGSLNLGLIKYRQARGYHGSEIGRDGDIDSLIQEVEWLRDEWLNEKHKFLGHIKGLEVSKKEFESENAKLKTANAVLNNLADVYQEAMNEYDLKIAELKKAEIQIEESKNKRRRNERSSF